ncbi:MAG: calcium/sodium antiporter [Arachnia sp.]
MIVAMFLAATLGGLVLLWLASDQFVVGASSLAARLNISPLVVGVVVMGFGTSAPELVVSAVAALSGSPEVGIGNVVGSNLANLTLVLGVAALMSPLTVSSGVIRREAFLALGATVAFAVAVQGDLHRWEGILLMVLLAGVLVLLVRSAQRVPAPEPPVETSAEPASRAAGRPALRDGVRTLLALLAIVVGADLLVRGALGIADLAGLSGGFVGVTVVALGTSLPELATAIAAARRGETNLIIGNLLGSNLFNALAVGGVVITIAPGPFHEPNLTTIGTAAMVAAALVALAFMRTGHRVGRVEAALLIVGYVAVLPLLM